MRLEERKAAIRTGVALCRQAGKRARSCRWARADDARRAGAGRLCGRVRRGRHLQRAACRAFRTPCRCSTTARSSRPAAGCPPSSTTCRSRARRSRWGEVLETLSIEGVAGIKCSSDDLFFTEQLAAAKPAGSVLFNGKDEYLGARGDPRRGGRHRHVGDGIPARLRRHLPLRARRQACGGVRAAAGAQRPVLPRIALRPALRVRRHPPLSRACTSACSARRSRSSTRTLTTASSGRPRR